MKEWNHQPRIIHAAKVSFGYEEEIKAFPDKQKLSEFSTTRPALEKYLKEILLPETKKKKKVYKILSKVPDRQKQEIVSLFQNRVLDSYF